MPDDMKRPRNGFSMMSDTLEADPGVHNIPLAGAKGTAGGQVDWTFCKIDANAYIGPAATASTYSRQAAFSLKILIPDDLATHWSDADGDPVALTAAIASTNGAAASYDNNYVYYTNPNNVTDHLNYTIADGQGGTGSAIIAITVNTAPSVGSAQNITVSGNSATVNFAGIPAYQYEIQRSTNLVDWVTLLTTNAPANGLFNFTHNFNDLGAIAPSSPSPPIPNPYPTIPPTPHSPSKPVTHLP